MLKRDTRRHKAKAMLKQSGCYSNILMYCMYAKDATLPCSTVDSPFPGSGKHISAIQIQRRYLALEKAYNRG
ncbi:hypothetical protein DWS77_16365 [Escherichia coli]|nr:hypothetical protein [Escherichia coli]